MANMFELDDTARKAAAEEVKFFEAHGKALDKIVRLIADRGVNPEWMTSKPTGKDKGNNEYAAAYRFTRELSAIVVTNGKDRMTAEGVAKYMDDDVAPSAKIGRFQKGNHADSWDNRANVVRRRWKSALVAMLAADSEKTDGEPKTPKGDQERILEKLQAIYNATFKEIAIDGDVMDLQAALTKAALALTGKEGQLKKKA